MSVKIKRFSIRFLICLLVFCILITSSVGVSADNNSKKSLDEAVSDILTISNDTFTLTLNKEDGNFALTDKRTNTVWYANPLDAKEDEIAAGITKTNLRSQLLVRYVENNSRAWTNNLTSSILLDGATFTVKKNTILATYEFVDEDFVIPVEYSISDNGFTAKILLSKIKEKGFCKINEIQFLPYFGASSVNDEGYMLVPDGSGAIIEFNNGKSDLDIYSKSLYGGEQTLIPNKEALNEQKIALPIFGIKNGENAVAAIITEGASNAKIEAAVSGKLCNYNRIYSSVVYRECNTIELTATGGTDNMALFSALNPTKLKSYEVSYSFLKGDKANYVGMASVMREQLEADGFKQNASKELPLFIDFYGAVKREKAFLGIRYSGADVLTQFAAAKDILADIKENKIDRINAGYKNISRAEIFGKVANEVSPMSKLGGRSDFNELAKYAEKNNIELYPYGDFISFSKAGKGYNRLFDATFSLDLSVCKSYPYSIVSNLQDKSEDAFYLVKPNKYDTSKRKLSKSLSKLDSSGVYFDASVNKIYSNFAKNGFQRDRAVGEMKNVYKTLTKDKNGILMSAPNFYALTYASKVTDLPLASSREMIFDYDIPFLQIVLSGISEYSSLSVNIGGYSKRDVLKHIESGSGLKYSLIEANGRELLHTNLDYLYGATYSNCKNELVDLYRELSSVYEKTEGSTIVLHQRKGEQVKVGFQNSCVILINYGNDSVYEGETKIDAESFVILEDGE